jgi:hypothetical protein
MGTPQLIRRRNENLTSYQKTLWEPHILPEGVMGTSYLTIRRYGKPKTYQNTLWEPHILPEDTMGTSHLTRRHYGILTSYPSVYHSCSTEGKTLRDRIVSLKCRLRCSKSGALSTKWSGGDKYCGLAARDQIIVKKNVQERKKFRAKFTSLLGPYELTFLFGHCRCYGRCFI